MNYLVKQGELISDVAINACGSVAALEDILNLNEFSEWTPELLPGQILEVPAVIDSDIQKYMALYPANNAVDIPDLSTKLSTFTGILDSAVIYDFTPGEITQEFINYYTVRENESITDVCLNSTGAIDNWEAILTANEFDEWVPTLSAGQKVIIPVDAEIQNNILMLTSKYPANNGLEIPNIETLISDFITTLGMPWILDTGYWDDSAYWLDQKRWIDGT
jgi:hypothetical protein